MVELLDVITFIIAESDNTISPVLMSLVAQSGLIHLETVYSGTRLIKKSAESKPDLLFIHTNLNKLDGIAASQSIRKSIDSPEIILFSPVQNAQDYDSAFNLNALDLLVYPFNIDRINRAVQKARMNIQNKKNSKKYSLINAYDDSCFIYCKRNYRDYYIKENYIVSIEKISKRTIKLVLIDGEVIESSSLLEEIKNQDSKNLFSPHRSYIVNMKYVQSIFADPEVPGNYIVNFTVNNQQVPMTKNGYVNYCNKYNLHY